MKNNDIFIDFYNKYFKKKLNNYCNEIRKKYYKKRNTYIIESMLFGFLIIVFLLLSKNINLYYRIVIIILLFVCLCGLTIFNIRLLNKYKRELMYYVNTFIYTFNVAFLSKNDYFYEDNTQLAMEDFDKIQLFNLNILHYTGDNLTAAVYNKKKFVMCDVCLYDVMERIRTDSYFSELSNINYIINYHYKEKVDIFKGLYYETTINRDNNQYIYMIPNKIKDKFVNKNIYHYISYDGIKIELENLDFSEKYSVFSLDEIKSRYVLSLTLMEKINNLDGLIKNKKYFVFKSDGRVGIYIDGLQIEDMLNQKIDFCKEISLEYLLKYYDKIFKLFNICMLLEDINPYSDI